MSKDLFLLVKSLTKTEKRYFSKNANKGSGKEDPNYIRLFNMLNKMEVYEEEKLPKLKIKNLAYEKNYLYNAILKSMRNYRSEKSAYAKITEQILDANFLLERGMYDQSQKVLNKAKKLAETYHQTLSLIEINKLERVVVTNLRPKNYTSIIESLVEESKTYTECIEEEQLHSNNSYLLFNELTRQLQLTDEEKKKEVIERFSIAENSSLKSKSIHADYFLNQSKIFYHKLLGSFELVLECYSNISSWWDENESLKKENFSQYITDISNYISMGIESKNYQIVPELFEKIEKISPQNPHQELVVFNNLVHTKLLFFFNTARLDEATGFIKETEEKIKKYDLVKQRYNTIAGNIALFYFFMREFNQSLLWIEEITDNKNVEVRLDIQRFIRVLKVLCLFELGQDDHFDNSIRSAYRYLNSTTTSKYSFIESELLDFIKKIASIPLSSREQVFKELKSFLIDKTKNPSTENIPGFIAYLIWVKSKIHKKTMLSILKEERATS